MFFNVSAKRFKLVPIGNLLFTRVASKLIERYLLDAHAVKMVGLRT